MELGHFVQHFVKNTTKKGPAGKHFEFSLLGILKTTFSIVKFTKDGHNHGTFFNFQKKAGDTSPPTLVVRL